MPFPCKTLLPYLQDQVSDITLFVLSVLISVMVLVSLPNITIFGEIFGSHGGKYKDDHLV
jgi:hypothetical protein